MGYAWIHFRHIPYLNSEVIFKNSSINSGYILTWLKNDASNHLNPQRGRERESCKSRIQAFKVLSFDTMEKTVAGINERNPCDFGGKECKSKFCLR